MFERESGDFDPEHPPRSHAEDGAQNPTADYSAGAIPLSDDPVDPLAPYESQAYPEAPPAPAASGNRPAEQATHSDSASHAQSDWRASDAATDFLGLDDAVFVDEPLSSEFTPVTDDFQAPVDVPPQQEQQGTHEALTDVDDPNNWLMDMDDAGAESMGQDVLDGDVELPDQLDASYSEADPKGKLKTWVVRGAAAAAVLAVCVTLIQLYSSADEVAPPEPSTPIEPTGGQVARDEQLTRPTGSATTDSGPNATTTVDDPQTAAVERESFQGSQPAGPDVPNDFGGQTTAEVADQTIRDSQGDESVAADVAPGVQLDENGQPLDPSQLDPTGDAFGVRDPFDDVALDNSPGSATQEPGMNADGSGPVVVGGELAGGGLGETEDPGGLRYASATDLAGFWDGTTIPLDSIDNTSRIVTPNVGRVRAVMRSGEIFEGRMYAVGEGKLWIDNGLGRMALTGSNLEKVEHVLSADGSPGLGEPGSQEYAGLPRVRAKAPGGVFFGKLIHQDGDRVTLITEEGARLTLEGAVIDPAPSTKRVIVRGYDPNSAPPAEQ